MLLIVCPWCGPRAETEFSYGGEAGIVRPPDPDALSDAEWADYLFNRANPRGAHRELWNHGHGCRRWFVVERDTVTYRIERSYTLDGARTDPGPGSGSATVVKAETDWPTGSGATGAGMQSETDVESGTAPGVADGD